MVIRMQKCGLFRFLAVCVISILVFFYNFFGVLNSSQIESFAVISQKEEKEETPQEEIKENQKEEKNPQQEEQPTVETQPTEEKAQEVSAEAVKGKIIEKYISPYTASLNYDGVYIKNGTDLDINIKKIMGENVNLQLKKNSEPQVLIMHTHTTETFMSEDLGYYTDSFSSRTTNNEKNMAKIGAVVAKRLNDAGIKTIHDTTQHDYPSYTGSYTRAAKTVCDYIKQYPSIKVVLDLHRDALSSGESDKVKLVTEINGKKAAQVMLVMGSQSGGVKNFPNWQENFKLAVKIQQKIEKKYPTLARPLSLMSKNYNQSLTNGSVLIEFGTDANTLDEAIYSAQLVSDALIELFGELEK